MKQLVPIAIVASGLFAQTDNRVTLVVDVDNVVNYRSDVADPALRGTNASLTATPAMRPFTDALNVGDVIAVNGKPARGLWTSRIFVMAFSPTPTPGTGIADRASGSPADCKWEFADENGRFIGAILDGGYAPHGVTGGVGAFYGVRGQMGGPAPPDAPPLPPQRPTRIASTSEDPANRRVLGGGTARIVFTLIPAERPEIQAAFHENFAPVTATNPARPGELLILQASGLGPLVPGMLPSSTISFPNPPVEVNSPVEAVFGTESVPVLTKIGWPGQVNTYRVDVRIPSGAVTGEAGVQLTAAWIPGGVFRVPVRN
jgi:hypothetical protein